LRELTCLELSVVLWIAHLLCVLGAAQLAVPLGWRLSSRDAPAAPKGVLFGRASRAFVNYVENFTVFAALDLTLVVINKPGGWGPAIWIVARVFYLPLYLLDVIYWRTIAWSVALVGILIMLARLAAA
jgi:uncharacterized MAPEG superfamily protein